MPKFIFGALTFAVLSMFQYANATEKSPVQIKVSSTGFEGSARHATLLKFKEGLEKKLGDRVQVLVSAPSSSYKDGQEFEALGFDLVNIIVPATSLAATNYDFKDLYLFDLPFLFRTKDDYKKYINSPLPNNLLTKFANKEHLVTPLAIWSGDYKNFYTTSPFVDITDGVVRGGIVESKEGLDKIYQNTLGISTVRTTSKNHLPSIVNKGGSGVPDVVDTNSSFILEKGLNNYYNNLTKSEHAVDTYIVLANKRWLNSLPKDIQEAIKEISVDLSAYYLEEDIKRNAEALSKLKAGGVVVHDLSNEQKNMFINRAIPAHEHYLKNIDAQYLQEVYKTVR